MLKTKRMTRMSIVGPRSVMRDMIRELHGMKLLHIDDYVKKDEESGFDIGSPLEESETISRSLVKLRSIESYMPKTKNAKSGKLKADDIDKVDANISKIESDVVEKIEEMKSIDEEQGRLNSFLSDLSVISGLSLKLDVFSQYNSLKYFVGYVKNMDFEPKIRKITEKCNIYAGEHGKRQVAAVFVEKDKADDILHALNESGFSEINTDRFLELSGTTEKMIDEINSKISKLDKKKEKINGELAEISKKWGAYIKSNEEHLADEAEIAQAPLRFSVSRNAFIVDGWILSEKYDVMCDRLHSASNSRIFIKRYEDVGNAPIELDNKGPAKSFGFFMDLYSLPSYKEIDPTFFMFLIFPVFFGFMLGDWGYGVLTLIIFTLLRFKVPKAKDILNVLIIASISTIVFGLLYDEFFGIELFHEMGIHFPYHLLTRSEPAGATMLIVYALGLGVLHISVGYLIGFINELRAHGLKAAILEKLGWIIYMAGFFPAILAFFGMVESVPSCCYILLVLGAVMIVWGEGIKGALELISPLTNTLSYARLMAVGLVSVILAEVVNEMAHPMFHAGGLGFVMGAAVLVAGHSVNICLGLLSPFIHSMRLHYVEFFLKFYHGGGKKYVPFGLKENM